MKKLSTIFTGLALAAMMTPAISMAQDTPKDDPAPQEQQQVKAVGFPVPVQACTTDGFSEEAVVAVVAQADEVEAAGGTDAVFTDEFKATAVKELADAWKAVLGDLTSEQMGKEGPSKEFLTSAQTHLKTVADDLSKKSHVHIFVPLLQLAAPTEGCPAPAPQ